MKIQEVAFGGKGVGRAEGKVIFVPFTIEGEIIAARIVQNKKQFAEAEVVEIKQESARRVDPPCPYFGRCGGCAYQHIEYEHQLAIKSRQVSDLLQRIGKFENVPLHSIIPSPLAYNYRNRITVHVEGETIGYFRRESRYLIDVERCPIATEDVNRELNTLHIGKPRDGHYTLRAQSGPRIFSQTNDAVASLLRDLVVKLVPPKQGLLIDAYCGAGFFAKALLDKFQRVLGIDWDKFAIAEAKKDAAAKETYITGDVEDELAELHRRESVEPNSLTLIVDPPASGLTKTIRAAILNLAPTNFIYVSCNPSTLARDLREFKEYFAIESVTPLDMFPQTAEIEVVAHLRRFTDSSI